MKKMLVFLCGARDFHAMDWYKSAKTLIPDNEIIILTDLISGEGYKKLISEADRVEKLIILDKLLLNTQSKIAHLWRNFLKLLFFPIQVFLVKNFARNNPNAIYHAHSMYYLFLGWAANITYVGTPQGSDILIKPYRSAFYRYFAVKSLKSAKAITVDSVKMQTKVRELTGIEAHIIQNGVDVESIIFQLNKTQDPKRETILSIRGITPLYRIKEILNSRNNSKINKTTPISFIYPFSEDQYYDEVKPLFISNDRDLKRLDRYKMYELLMSSKLVISIPVSDSSPRSVYEAIFCGSPVAITYHPYYDSLPECMKSRIILIDIDNYNWFDKAMMNAEVIAAKTYEPSKEALHIFDQKNSFKIIEKLLFS